MVATFTSLDQKRLKLISQALHVVVNRDCLDNGTFQIAVFEDFDLSPTNRSSAFLRFAQALIDRAE
jgi:hypothetical protein